MIQLENGKHLHLHGKLLILPLGCQVSSIENNEYDYDVILILGNNRTIDLRLSQPATIIIEGSTGVVINILGGMGSGLSQAVFLAGNNHVLNKNNYNLKEVRATIHAERRGPRFDNEIETLNLKDLGSFNEIEIVR